MFSSLPPLFPHDVLHPKPFPFPYTRELTYLQPHTLWYPSLSNHPQPSSASPNETSQNPHSPIIHHRNAINTPHNPQRTSLSVLRNDENLILQRKANIRRFGAGWLRPPGVGKTLQGIDDERAEREEVESARARYTQFLNFPSQPTMEDAKLI